MTSSARFPPSDGTPVDRLFQVSESALATQADLNVLKLDLRVAQSEADHNKRLLEDAVARGDALAGVWLPLLPFVESCGVGVASKYS